VKSVAARNGQGGALGEGPQAGGALILVAAAARSQRRLLRELDPWAARTAHTVSSPSRADLFTVLGCGVHDRKVLAAYRSLSDIKYHFKSKVYLAASPISKESPFVSSTHYSKAESPTTRDPLTLCLF